MHRQSARLAALALGLLLTACNFEKKAPSAPAPVAPNEAQARAFAEKFIELLAEPDVPGATAMIDWDTLLARATADTYGSPRNLASFIKGAKSPESLASYVQQLSNSAQAGAQVKFLRVRGDETGRSVLVRVLHPTGGVNYHELLLTNDKGVVRAVDVYVYAAGEYMSDVMRRMYKTATAAKQPFIDRLLGKKHPAMQMATMYKEMAEKTTSGRHAEAVALFKRMPPELRREKSAFILYVTASSSMDEEQYRSAIEELRAAFPNDAGLDLMLIDGYVLRQRYDDALAAIDRLDRDLDGDPYLDLLRASTCRLKRDEHNAVRYTRRAVEREPELAALMR